jgi:uncharacterized protein (TIGR02452 family)
MSRHHPDTDEARAQVFADNENRVFPSLLASSSKHRAAVIASVQGSTLYCEHDIPRIAVSALASAASASAAAASASASAASAAATTEKTKIITPTRIHVVNMDLLVCARMLIDQGVPAKEIAVHNMSSDKTGGGGSRKGRKAAEESKSRRGTLFMSLDVYYRRKLSGGGGKKIKDWYADGGMAEDELSYNPNVLIFRDEHDNMLPSEDDYWSVSIISSHAIRRPALDPNDTRYMAKKQDAVAMVEKFRAILRLAHAKGHRHLILSAHGSGAFRCPPRHIAEIILNLLFAEPEFSNVFVSIHFAIIDTYLGTSNYTVYRDLVAEYKTYYGLDDTSAAAAAATTLSSESASSAAGGSTHDTTTGEEETSSIPLTKNQKRRLRKKLLEEHKSI